MVCVSYYVPQKVRREEHKIHEMNLKTDLLTETYLVCVLYLSPVCWTDYGTTWPKMTICMKKTHKVHNWNWKNPLCNSFERANNFNLWGEIVFCYVTKTRRISLELKQLNEMNLTSCCWPIYVLKHIETLCK